MSRYADRYRFNHGVDLAMREEEAHEIDHKARTCACFPEEPQGMHWLDRPATPAAWRALED